jgi:hypothetical protein
MKVTGMSDVGTGPLGVIGNIICFVLAGWWLALGHLLTALALAIVRTLGVSRRLAFPAPFLCDEGETDSKARAPRAARPRTCAVMGYRQISRARAGGVRRYQVHLALR